MCDASKTADPLSEAIEHQRAGRVSQAKSICQDLLARQPGRVDVLESLAQLEFQTGNASTADDLLRQAISLSPGSPHLYANLANVLAAQMRFHEALPLYRRALEMAPQSSQAMANFAAALRNHGSIDESIQVYRRAAEMLPYNADIRFKLGIVLLEKGELPAAGEALASALSLRSEFPEARDHLAFCLFQYGLLLFHQGRRPEAIEKLRQSLSHKPLPSAYCTLGDVLLDEARLDDARQAYEAALQLRPGFDGALVGLGLVSQYNGQPEKAKEYYLDAWNRGQPLAGHNLLIAAHLDPSSDPKSLYEIHERWNQREAAGLAREAGGYANDRSPDRRLRVGLVSAYFDFHPIGRFLAPLLANHDRGQFEMICYSDVRLPDATTESLRGWADGWRSTNDLSHEQLATLIRDDQIDILIDLGMHTRRNRLLVFARKPAPVQVTYLAYCSTTGLQTIDYRFSDPYLDPLPHAQIANLKSQIANLTQEPFYSEKTVRLRSYWCYPAPSSAPPVNDPPVGSYAKLTFGCLNDFSKINDLSLSMWGQILRSLPESRFVIHALEGSPRNRVTHAFVDWGVDPHRIEFVGRLSMADYFGQYQRIDIALDPTPWPGGTTTCDALWMGVPVVSMIGKTALSRGGLSILSQIGHPEWVARDQAEYVELAISLARNQSRLIELRKTLRETMRRSPLMDAVGFSRNFETVLRGLWREFVKAGSF